MFECLSPARQSIAFLARRPDSSRFGAGSGASEERGFAGVGQSESSFHAGTLKRPLTVQVKYGLMRTI